MLDTTRRLTCGSSEQLPVAENRYRTRTHYFFGRCGPMEEWISNQVITISEDCNVSELIALGLRDSTMSFFRSLAVDQLDQG
jgi:hypothetical protein